MIKKRQAMRNTFGDYRQKIKEEEKRTVNSKLFVFIIVFNIYFNGGWDVGDIITKTTDLIDNTSYLTCNKYSEHFSLEFSYNFCCAYLFNLCPFIDLQV